MFWQNDAVNDNPTEHGLGN